jgi:lipid A 3-O-deacylase
LGTTGSRPPSTGARRASPVRARAPLIVTLLLLCSPSPAASQASGEGVEGASRDGRVELSLAYLDVSGRQGEAVALEVLHRPAWPRMWLLRPVLGGAIYTDGSAYVHGGVRLPLAIGNVVAEPSFAVGRFHRGSTFNLGNVVQFRSGLSIAFPLGEGRTVSLYLYHLSNAGLSERNPGVEVVGVGYTLPRFR